MSDLSLRTLQGLPWDMSAYRQEFLANPMAHRDFEHALAHVEKAMGRLWAMVEEADHKSGVMTSSFSRQDVSKYLADLVICAVRLANMNPSGPINLESAVIARAKDKLGVDLE